MQLNSEGTNFHITAEYNILNKKVVFLKPITWPNGVPPKDSPECGYDMSKCPRKFIL